MSGDLTAELTVFAHHPVFEWVGKSPGTGVTERGSEHKPRIASIDREVGAVGEDDVAETVDDGFEVWEAGVDRFGGDEGHNLSLYSLREGEVVVVKMANVFPGGK